MSAPVDRTETGMANGALALIGEPPITSLDDPLRAAARYAKRYFAEERDELLRSKDWQFARKCIVPSGVTCPNTHWAFRYTLPADCIAMLRIGDYDSSTDEGEWEVLSPPDDDTVATFLDTNHVAPLVYYTRRVVNPAQWDEAFARTFKTRLAAKINPLVGRDKTRTNDLYGAADKQEFRAAQRDSQQRNGETLSRTTSWVKSRWGYYNGAR